MHTSIDFPQSQRAAQWSTKIHRQLVQTVARRDDLVILAEQLLEHCLLIDVQPCLVDFLRNAVIQIQPRDAQLLAAVLIDEFDSAAVLLRSV